LIFELFPNVMFVYVDTTIQTNLKAHIVIRNHVRFKSSAMKNSDIIRSRLK